MLSLRPVRSIVILHALPVLATLLVVLLAMIFEIDSVGLNLLLLATFGIGGPGFVLLVSLLTQRLSCTELGLELRVLGKQRFCEWSGLEAISQNDLGRTIAEFVRPVDDAQIVREYMDLTPFVENWQASELSRAILEHVPEVKLKTLSGGSPAPYWVTAWPIFMFLLGLFLIGPLTSLPITTRYSADRFLVFVLQPLGLSLVVSTLLTAARLLDFRTWFRWSLDLPQARRRALGLYSAPFFSAVLTAAVAVAWYLWWGGYTPGSGEPLSTDSMPLAKQLPIVVPIAAVFLQAYLLRDKRYRVY